MDLLDKIKQNQQEIIFEEVISYIDEHYHFKPIARTYL